MVVGETKLDDSYPTSQLNIAGYSEPFRLVYVMDCIPCKQLQKHTIPDDIEGMFIELNCRKNKWLLFGTYHPPSQNDEYFFRNVENAFDTYIRTYEKCILAGLVSETKMEKFLGTYGLSSLINDKNH